MFTLVFNKTKRYALDMDMYIYAKDDEEAKQFTDSIVKMLNEKFDNHTKAKKLVEIPFASTTHREIEITK